METGKLKGKQTSIAAVRDQFLSFATFLTHFLFRYRLPVPLKVNNIYLKVKLVHSTVYHK
jgi:hypothetical protein